MKFRTTNEVRNLWLKFFEENDHLVLESKSLIPKDDASLLWINSGVATLKQYFSGEKIPPHLNLTNSQKSIRTNDIENVGVTSRHHTFFEMLGSFSIGGYFKEKAIELAYNIMVNHFEMDLTKVYITVFKDDFETYNTWIKLGINKNHIIKCDKNRNFWDIGQGPCGPCTEMFYDRGEKYDPENKGIVLFEKDIENDRYIEFWNIVFSEFNNDGNGNYSPLARKNIDTGAGLERLACLMQDVPTNFDTDSFKIIMKSISTLTDLKYDSNNYFKKDAKQEEINKSYRIISDHLKACVFAIADGAMPSNKDRGYIIRKLIRRSMIYGKKININNKFLNVVAEAVIDAMKEYYPSLKKNKEIIFEILSVEENKFNSTLSTGLIYFEEMIKDDKVNAKNLFKLFDTYGFPLETLSELLDNKKIIWDKEEFNQLLLNHQKISRRENATSGMQSQKADLLALNVESNFHYDKHKLESKIIKIFDENFKSVESVKSGVAYLVFKDTPFYATSGGQFGDTGFVEINGEKLNVVNVSKAPNLQHLHKVNVNNEIKINDLSNLEINVNEREKISKNHTSEHLLHITLKKCICESIKQEGASKTFDKLTLDFSYPKKLTQDQLDLVENTINNLIKEGKDVETIITDLENANKFKAIALFTDVYKKNSKNIRIVKIGDESIELCGGTHVKNIKEIEQFHIIKFLAKGSGAWRIEAISGNETTNRFIEQENEKIKHAVDKILIDCNNDLTVKSIYNKLVWDNNWLNFRNNEKLFLEIQNVSFEVIKKNQQKNMIELQNTFIKEIQSKPQKEKNIIFLLRNYPVAKNLHAIFSDISNQFQDKTFIVLNVANGKTSYFVISNKNNIESRANVILSKINKNFGGFGGGSAFFSQGGCNKELSQSDTTQIEKII